MPFWNRNDQLLLTLGLCKDGDVRLEEDGTPLLYYDHKWSPICGHSFRDDNNGATTFCKKLGYGSGKVTRINGRYPVANLRIGKCRAGQELISCTAGGNYLNYNILEYRYCTPTESASISITCDQKGDSYSSCNLRKFLWTFVIVSRVLHESITYLYLQYIFSKHSPLGNCEVPKAIVSGYEYSLPDEKITWSSQKQTGFRLNGNQGS